MSHDTNQRNSLADLRDDIEHAGSVTPDIITRAVALSGVRATTHLRELVRAEAWTDAALCLVEAALPAWKVVRLAFDEGEWCCALAPHWQLPEWLDDVVETREASLPLAILGAFVEAREASLDALQRPSHSQRMSRDVLIADNFA